MARSLDVTLSRLVSLQRTFDKAGFSPEDVARMIDDPTLVRTMYRSVQRRLAVPMPPWYVLPQYQLKHARRLWHGLTLPEPPDDFTPQCDEYLLLHVPRPFTELWDTVVAPEGWIKERRGEIDEQYIRLAPNTDEFKEPVWLAFNPEHGKGVRPSDLWGQPNLAGDAVFSALIQFPKWPLAWFYGASAPFLSGYQIKDSVHWSSVPYLTRASQARADQPVLALRLVEASVCWSSDLALTEWASPSVRVVS